MTELLTEEGHRLRLEGEPRVGGESRVYEARGPSGERWAVKLALLPLPAGRWLHEEYELLRELGEDPRTAPHVARVRGRGHWGDRPFVALDWYPDTLATWVTRDPPVADRLAMARVVAQAVDALHDARPGLCHRDVKPSNVLLGPDGDVRLADFGAARAARPGATTTTTAVFSEGFAAPELTLPVPARPARHQDVYALAATVFFTLVGHAPAAVARSARALTPAGRALRGDHAGA
ncbi:MAG: protein kinase domain-containing protein, partial [Myxococcota bacterium]